MEQNYLGDDEGFEEMLASGDATKPVQNLQVTPSLLALCAEPIMEENENDLLDTIVEETPPPLPEGMLPPVLEVMGSSVPELETHPGQNGLTLPENCISLPSIKDKNARDYITGAERCRIRQNRSSTCVPSNKPSMKMAHLARLLTCETCHAMPITSATVHACPRGHQVCGTCYANGILVCGRCKQRLEGRNEPLECVLQQLRQVYPTLFPQDNISLDLELLDRLKDVNKRSKSAILRSSHRPINCPHLSCPRVVASNGFLAHFEFEHSSVPVVQMVHGRTRTFTLPANCLRDSLPRAVSVIEICTANRFKVEAVQVPNESPRLASFPLRRDAVICVLVSAAVRFGDCSFLVAWCACLYEDLPPVAYSLRAHTAQRGNVCYRGPMTSLHHSQEPRNIMKNAQCLILAPGSFSELCIRNNGVITLDLKFKFLDKHN